MKDKDGLPIIPLPPKTIVEEHLDFSADEREIYKQIFKNAKSRFLGYAQEGSVLRNVTAIFAILMRLRQAVCHPLLVLKNLNTTDVNLRSEDRQLAAEEMQVKRLITAYLADSKGSKEDIKALERLVSEAQQTECPYCSDVSGLATVLSAS